jgi:pilus assembly protein TadC
MSTFYPVLLLGSSVTCCMLAARPLWQWINFSSRLKRSLPKVLFQRYAGFLKNVMGKGIIKKTTTYLTPFSVVSQLEAEQYLALKTLGLFFCGVVALILGGNWVFPLCISGYILPSLILKLRLKRWRAAFSKQFPFAIDLLSLIVSSGTGLQSAVEEVAVSMPPGPLRDELWRALGHMILGASLREALEEFAQRSGIEEVQSFVTALVQAQQLGTELGGVLRVLVGSIRERTSQEAEERSQLLPMKMLVPLLFFIFPALLILLFAPFIVSGYLVF